MEINFTALLVSATIPTLLGIIFFHPLIFGQSSWGLHGLSPSTGFKKLIISYILGIFIAFIIQVLVIHQFGALGMIGGNVSEASPSYFAFMKDYGGNFRTFKHGALHGSMTAIFLVFPLLFINSIWERKSFKTVLVQAVFWLLNFTIMGAIICGWI